MSFPVSTRSRSPARWIRPENAREAWKKTGATTQATTASGQLITAAAAANVTALTAEVTTPRAPEAVIPSISATSRVSPTMRSPSGRRSKKSGGSRWACANRSSRSRSANRSLASEVRYSPKNIATAASAAKASHHPARPQNSAACRAVSTRSMMTSNMPTVPSSQPTTSSAHNPPSASKRRLPDSR